LEKNTPFANSRPTGVKQSASNLLRISAKPSDDSMMLNVFKAIFEFAKIQKHIGAEIACSDFKSERVKLIFLSRFRWLSECNP
jgi:hypothetical protein